MATTVGTQDRFMDALYQLCQLDFDTVEAYEAAINRLDNTEYSNQLAIFKADHEQHIRNITAILTKHNVKAPQGPGVKSLLADGKVVMANLFGDEAILKAMLTNEQDTNTAYERLNSRSDGWVDARDILRRGLEDERRHKAWIEATLAAGKQQRAA